MKVKLVLPEQEAVYIRHARTETLKNIGEDPTPEAIEPTPFAFYFIAYDEDGHRIGMAEIAMLEQVYGSFAESPYAGNFDQSHFAPISEMAGIRTIFVEPEYRRHAGSIYLQLILAGGRVVTALGAKVGTGTTNASDSYLGRLYEKTGGKALGTYRIDGVVKSDIALYVFDLDTLMNHKLIRRVASSLNADIDTETVHTLLSRSPQFVGRKSA